MDPQIQQILNGLVAVGATALTGGVVYLITVITPVLKLWVNNEVALVASKLTGQDYEIFKLMVATAVQDAEQRGLTKQIEDTATAKKAYALKTLQAELDKAGIPFDLASADSAIESAINQGLQIPPAQVAITETPTATPPTVVAVTPLQPITPTLSNTAAT
jgi:hypothetical protein